MPLFICMHALVNVKATEGRKDFSEYLNEFVEKRKMIVIWNMNVKGDESTDEIASKWGIPGRNKYGDCSVDV